MKSFVALLMIALALAGCAEDSAAVEPEEETFDSVEVTETLGGIRGVVVDQAIVPVAGAAIELVISDADIRIEESDAEGRFTFDKVPPGSYFLTITKPVYESAQAGVVVEPGVENPDVVKVQLNRMFDQDPYLETVQFKAFIGCAYSFGISSTCVNDYTRVDPTGTCPGGCAPFVTGVVDQREYQSEVGPGWQSIVWEMVWEISAAGTGEELGLTVSYASREGASHWFTTHRGAQPWRLQCDVGIDCPGMSESNGPPQIDPEGRDDLWNMLGAGASSVTVQQEVEIFQTNFYFGGAPGEWSFVNGDGDPF